MDKSEILVHISAPSGAVDDARYRAQVEAILNFQPRSCEIITTTQLLSPSSSTSEPRLKTIHNNNNPPPHAPDNVPLSSNQAPKQHVSQKDSFDSPVSVIPDSQPQHPGFDPESLSLQPTISLYSHSPLPPSKRPRVGSPPPVNHREHDEIQVQARPQSTESQTPPVPQGPEPKPGEPTHHNSPKSQPQPQPQNHNHTWHLPPLPLQINPPPPPISSSPFTTHITPTLSMLTQRLKSPRTYNPTTQTRDLDTLERGYWFLRVNLLPLPNTPTSTPSQKQNERTTQPPNTWDPSIFSKFWTFLSDFIGKEGRAGWGVWCILENLENEDDDDDENGRGKAKGETTGPSNDTHAHPQSLALKVYAWGEIACHIYILLFLASDRRIRKMGAQWRDGRDDVVIQMP
ncbi:hypothetical protein BDW59DRAFT_153387 [Aspergillus cavernicola]|uniref:Uncharacterized protein n=1 Tax=Aspergillus cavernicola TaxID=176166 RepID=A0ABR4HLI0_9EURO